MERLPRVSFTRGELEMSQFCRRLLASIEDALIHSFVGETLRGHKLPVMGERCQGRWGEIWGAWWTWALKCVRGLHFRGAFRADHWRVTPFPLAPFFARGERCVAWRSFGCGVSGGSAARLRHRLRPTPPWPPLLKGGKGGRGRFRLRTAFRADHWRVRPVHPPLQWGKPRGGLTLAPAGDPAGGLADWTYY